MIQFWNGNKSAIRQEFEWQALQIALQDHITKEKLNNDLTDYPSAKDEGLVFSKGADVLVTVAGNKKFTTGSYTMIPQPLCHGLLGCRILITHKERQKEFYQLDEVQLKQLRIGIPATWADADLFRANQYTVIEQGNLEERLLAVQNGECDYMALGANEASAIVKQYAHLTPDLAVEPTILLYYPFPLVFYCHPEQHELVQCLSQGLEESIKNSQLNQLFEKVYGPDVQAAKLNQRRVFQLTNPILPSELTGYQSPLLPNKQELGECSTESR